MLKAGIIGLGVGEQHIYGYRRSEYSEPVAICDLNIEKLTEVSNRSGIKYVSTCAEDIIDDPEIDIISIASFDECHATQVIRALEQGKHIFIEKPLCLTRQELNDICAAHKKSSEGGRLLHVSSNFILRHEVRFTKLRNRILGGQLGKIYCVEGSYDYGRAHKLVNGWRSCTDNYSVMHGGGIHLIDLLQWLTGCKFAVASALSNKGSTKNSEFKPVDNIISIGRFGDDIIGKISANFGSQTPHFHQIKIYGTKGTFVHDCGVAKYFFGSEANVIKELDATQFPSAGKGDIIPRFVEAIFTQCPQKIDFNRVQDVMRTSIEIDELALLS